MNTSNNFSFYQKSKSYLGIKFCFDHIKQIVVYKIIKFRSLFFNINFNSVIKNPENVVEP